MAEEPQEGVVAAPIPFGSPAELPLLYAHQAIINFTGSEFLVTIYRTAPEPWNAGEQLNPNIEAKPLARFAFSPVFWMGIVESASDQMDKLEAQGAITAEMRAAALRMLGR